MVFDAHDRVFAFFKGTCTRGIYDNMKTAVQHEGFEVGSETDVQHASQIGDGCHFIMRCQWPGLPQGRGSPPAAVIPLALAENRRDDRCAHWAAVYTNKDFVEGFASKFRPLLMTQEVKLLQAAPWGPHP
jgi:hypothetical protein